MKVGDRLYCIKDVEYCNGEITYNVFKADNVYKLIEVTSFLGLGVVGVEHNKAAYKVQSSNPLISLWFKPVEVVEYFVLVDRKFKLNRINEFKGK